MTIPIIQMMTIIVMMMINNTNDNNDSDDDDNNDNKGRGVSQSLPAALYWFREAATQELPD